MGKAALGALSAAMFGAMAVVTIVVSDGRQAQAENTHGGAGETVTKSAAPSTIDTPSAAPVVKATPYGAE